MNEHQSVNPLVSPFKMTSEQLAQNSHTDDASLPRSSDWLKICLMHSEALTRSGQCCVMSMEFMPSFVRHHFAGN